MRVVLDTSVLISAFVFPGGKPESVYRRALDGRIDLVTIDLVTSPPLLAEFGRILNDKFGWEGAWVETAVAHVARIGVLVQPSEHVAEIGADPDDDRVLEAALEGDAEWIVSGDKHLLGRKRWRGIRILTPTAFLGEVQ